MKQATVTHKTKPTETDTSKTNPPIEKTKDPKDAKDDVGVIIQVQAELNRLGCNAGVEDGIAGASTRRALRTFFKKVRLCKASSHCGEIFYYL